MTLIDANLLLYAYDPRATQHEASRVWLETTLSGSPLVRFAWVTLWAFIRISTNPRVFERPLSMAGLATMSPGEHLWTWVLGSLILGVILASLLAAAAYVALQALAWAGVHRSRRRAVEARYKSCPRAAQSFARWKLRLDRMFEILAGEDLRQGRVVDLGCGYGITLAWIAVEAPERELAGCDLSGERIHAARQALPAHRDSIGVADVRDFELGRAGLILIMDVLQYLEPAEQSALLTRCAAALEPGGGLIFRVHDWDAGIRSTLVMAFDRVILFLGGAGKRPANLPAVAYREMLAGTGLTIRERRFTNRLPLAHILFVATKPQESAG